MIKNYTIFGERCSGTNFLEHAINRNFDIELTWNYGNKHFFGFNSYENSDDVLFIGIVRNPYRWINSFFRSPWHLPDHLKTDKNNFLTGEFCSYHDVHSIKKDNTEIMEDRNIYTKKRYKNIFELRKTKCQYLLDDMSQNVKNFILIRYEDLRDSYIETLEIIKNKFNLKKKNDNYIVINGYKGLEGYQYTDLFEQKKLFVDESKDTTDFHFSFIYREFFKEEKIKKRLDLAIETRLFYIE